MKKIIIIFIVLISLIAIYFALPGAALDCPDYIYNYLEHGGGIRTTVNLDDYIVTQKMLSEISVYNKSTKESFWLGDTVFDYEKKYVAVMFSIGNELYYEAKDPNTKTKTVYAFDLDTYEKKKVYSQSGMTDTDGFLGMNKLLGIYNTYLMYTANAGKYIVNKDGFMYIQDVINFILEKDSDNKYNLSSSDMKIAANKYGIYFINNFDELLFYNYETKEIQRFMDNRVEDFFITDDGVYFSTLSDPDKLYKSNPDGKNKTYIGDIDLQDVRVKSGEPTYISDGENVYLIENNGLKPIFECEKESRWEYDGDALYYYDPESGSVRMQKIK